MDARRGRGHDDEFEAGEICERSVALSDWHELDGPSPFRAAIPVEEDEGALSAHGLRRSLRRTRLSASTKRRATRARRSSAATGARGAGAVATRAFVHGVEPGWLVRDAARTSTISSDAGNENGRKPDSSLRREAEDLVGRMIVQWPRERRFPSERKGSSEQSRMLSLLARLEDGGLIERFLTEVVATGCYERADNPALIKTLERLVPERRAFMIERIVAETAEKRFRRRCRS